MREEGTKAHTAGVQSEKGKGGDRKAERGVPGGGGGEEKKETTQLSESGSRGAGRAPPRPAGCTTSAAAPGPGSAQSTAHRARSPQLRAHSPQRIARRGLPGRPAVPPPTSPRTHSPSPGTAPGRARAGRSPAPAVRIRSTALRVAGPRPPTRAAPAGGSGPPRSPAAASCRVPPPPAPWSRSSPRRRRQDGRRLPP